MKSSDVSHRSLFNRMQINNMNEETNVDMGQERLVFVKCHVIILYIKMTRNNYQFFS